MPLFRPVNHRGDESIGYAFAARKGCYIHRDQLNYAITVGFGSADHARGNVGKEGDDVEWHISKALPPALLAIPVTLPII